MEDNKKTKLWTNIYAIFDNLHMDMNDDKILTSIYEIENVILKMTAESNSKYDWSDNDIDAAYLMGCINVGGIDGLSKELERLKEMGTNPHDAVRSIRTKINF